MELKDLMYAGSMSSRDQPLSPIFLLSFLLLGMGKRGGYEADSREQLCVPDQLQEFNSIGLKRNTSRAVPCRSLHRDRASRSPRLYSIGEDA